MQGVEKTKVGEDSVLSVVLSNLCYSISGLLMK